MSEDAKEKAARRKKNRDSEVLFRRADTFRHMLMEDFRFMEAARMSSGEYEAATLKTEDLQPRQKLKNIMNTNPNGLVNFSSYVQRPSSDNKKRAKFVNSIQYDARMQRFNTRMSGWPPVCIWAHWLHNTKIFAWIMVCVIVMNSVLVAVDQELGQDEGIAHTRVFLEGLDFLFLFMFVAEILLKWMDDFSGFWKDGWNIFDFLITSVSLIAPMLDLLFPESDETDELEIIILAVKYLRIVRILRSLNVVTRVNSIQVMWGTVLRTFSSMVFITALMLIFFFIYAIIGVQIFDRFTRSHRNPLEYREAFRDLPKAFVTLFQLFTFDHYANLIADLVKVHGWWIVTTYTFSWILLCSFIFCNIFAGIMVNTFQNIRAENLEESSSINEKRRIANQLNIFGAEDEDDDGPAGDNSGDGQARKNSDSKDPCIDWENEIYHTLDVVNALGYGMSPTIWPRDTLFQYYMILEALASNIDERNCQLRLLDEAILRMFDT